MVHTGLVDVQLNSTMCLVSGTLRSTPLPWLPVLANNEPPALYRKAATDKLVKKIIAHDNWPIHSDITYPPRSCFPSMKPLCHDLWKSKVNGKNWRSAQVVNFSLVDDPTIRQPGFYLPRQQWSLLLTVFRLRKVTVVSEWSYGIRQPLICVPAMRNKRCPTLSTLFLWQS